MRMYKGVPLGKLCCFIFAQLKLLNVITVGPRETDNIKQMMTGYVHCKYM